MKRRTLIAGGAGLFVGGVGLMAGAGWRAFQRSPGDPRTEPLIEEPAPVPTPAPPKFDLSKLDGSQLVSIDATGWHSWALIDHNDGAMTGSATFNEISRTCSVIKVWIAADYLRTKNPSSSKQAAISKMIRDSDNASATTLFAELGKSASFKRMQEMCGLTDFTPGSSWGQCQMSSRDMARLAAKVQDGTAAGPNWTEWLISEMRLVRLGTWGIREAFPPDQAAQLPIKNGWDTTAATKTRHMNCMAITSRWSLMVMTRYPISYSGGDRHGQAICRDVTAQLLQREELKPLFEA
ncbi:serine hydrolase [Allorhizocola rhizosphaerae]|uniref:serine hydrolase n=1 Tax=Allorhizocola rhizosphaerae TaxID=1872709 RepID=UPI000E3D465D|nr:serine hydrolase [Allorhizocola rhizosphaerae]